MYFSNIFGPLPPSVTAIAWVGQAQWLLEAWGYWIDRHRHALANQGLPSDYMQAMPPAVKGASK